ncbi:MAG: hypothetical protein GMKNLPBB_01816 [Myxococcota bacterium]|nr:hypothetical protein [Myxococcota bacterium]
MPSRGCLSASGRRHPRPATNGDGNQFFPHSWPWACNSKSPAAASRTDRYPPPARRRSRGAAPARFHPQPVPTAQARSWGRPARGRNAPAASSPHPRPTAAAGGPRSRVSHTACAAAERAGPRGRGWGEEAHGPGSRAASGGDVLARRPPRGWMTVRDTGAVLSHARRVIRPRAACAGDRSGSRWWMRWRALPGRRGAAAAAARQRRASQRSWPAQPIQQMPSSQVLQNPRGSNRIFTGAPAAARPFLKPVSGSGKHARPVYFVEDS